jgi:4'-phosphopantetheinyl transferase EntD
MGDTRFSHLLARTSFAMSEYLPFIKNSEVMEFLGYPGLLALSADFDVLQFDDRLFDDFSCDFISEILNSVNKRKAEYLAGRVMAMKGLELLGSSELQVNIGKHRAPLWPAGYLGSITHTSQKVIAVVARKKQYNYIGIDCENIFGQDVFGEIKGMIVNLAEVAYLSRVDVPMVKLMTLVFSAKETFFKAVYPYVLHYFDFDAVEIIEISLEKQTFTLMICKDLTPFLKRKMEFDGIFIFDSNTVLTAIFC